MFFSKPFNWKISQFDDYIFSHEMSEDHERSTPFQLLHEHVTEDAVGGTLMVVQINLMSTRCAHTSYKWGPITPLIGVE